MPGGEALRAEPRGVVEADAELDLAIAEHVGIGRAAGAILGQEVFEHACAVLLGEAHAMQRDAELDGHRSRVLEILRAGAVGVVVLPVAHVEPVHVEAGAFQQQRGNGGVDAAGHADDDSFGCCLTRRGLYAGLQPLQVDDGVHVQGGVEPQRGHRVEWLALAEQEVLEATQDQRRAQARGLRQQLFVRHPHGAHDADVERLLGA